MNASRSKLFLYHSATSVCSQKVRLVLAELELAWEGQILDLARGDQFEAAYLALNPAGVVPTLLFDDRCVVESNVIMAQLCDHCPDSSLSQQHRCALDVDRQWLEKSGDLHSAINALTYAAVNRKKLQALSREELASRINRIPDPARGARLRDIVERGYNSSAVVRALECLAVLLPEIEQRVENSLYLSGENAGLADLAVLPFILRLELLGLAFLWQSKRAALASWLQRMKERNSFGSAVDAFLTAAARAKFSAAAPEAAVKVRRCLSQ